MWRPSSAGSRSACAESAVVLETGRCLLAVSDADYHAPDELDKLVTAAQRVSPFRCHPR